MSSIVTFYSFKGGVGRSMALANIAVLLAKRGLRVLAVDWDLEAPGLERYFEYFDMRPIKDSGLLPLLLKVAEDPEAADPTGYRSHVWEVNVEAGMPLFLLPSGRQEHASYAKSLEKLTWPTFFELGGGEYLERLRNQWREDYDLVLIDSRTGLSDAGGICTIQMPDILVAMFTPNQQSMLGVRDVIDAVQAGRQRLAHDRMQLTVLPVPCRFSSTSEMKLSQSWLDQFAEVFARHVQDWLPVGVAPRSLFERLKLPQVDWFGFGEKLAVVEQGISDPASLGFICDRIAELLASEFQNLEHVLGPLPKPERKPMPKPQPRVDKDRDSYQYDLFVSSAGDGIVREWTSKLVSDLAEWSALDHGEPLRIFFDKQEIAVGSSWSNSPVLDALVRSKLLLVILTPRYFTSEWCLREWAIFAKKERQLESSQLIIPILLRGGHEFPAAVRNRRMFDASRTLTGQESSAERAQLLSSLSKELVELVREVPSIGPFFEPNPDPQDLAELMIPSQKKDLPSFGP
jgi:cellulose biosynthesis protein BcsQ